MHMVYFYRSALLLLCLVGFTLSTKAAIKHCMANGLGDVEGQVLRTIHEQTSVRVQAG